MTAVAVRTGEELLALARAVRDRRAPVTASLGGRPLIVRHCRAQDGRLVLTTDRLDDVRPSAGSVVARGALGPEEECVVEVAGRWRPVSEAELAARAPVLAGALPSSALREPLAWLARTSVLTLQPDTVVVRDGSAAVQIRRPSAIRDLLR